LTAFTNVVETDNLTTLSVTQLVFKPTL